MRAAIIGYGKMGKEIEIVLKDHNHTIGKIIDDHSKLKEVLRGSVDVVIEFSQPESAFNNIRHCLREGIPVVSGTTGWLEHKTEIDKICHNENGAFLYASNFSVGVNLFFELNKKLAVMMSPYKDYQADIHEVHHTTKKDAPSGTAITLAEDLINNHSAYHSWKNDGGESSPTLPITSERIENIPGTHIITYRSEIDDISIKHEAKSRKGFALGAVIAAEWILGKKGVFSMSDVLFSS